jgi:hypothetical protein
MPQDNWRYDQKQFTGPDPNQPLRSIAVGFGGVYVGRGSPSAAVLQFQDNGVFLREFGTFANICGIACNAAGNVHVLDATNSTLTVSVFDANGVFLRQWGSPGTKDGQFGRFESGATSMIAANEDGEVFVCDPGNTRVQVFDQDGNFLRKWGNQGSLPNEFSPANPLAIAVAPITGKVYAGSYIWPYSGALAVFDKHGKFLKAGGSPTSAGIFYSYTVTHDGLFISGYYRGGGNISDVYDENLSAIRSFPGGESQQGLAVSKRGNLYSIQGSYVQVFEREYSSVQSPPTPPALPEPIVLSISQRTNTAWLDVDYEVIHADGSSVTTAALAFINGANALSSAVPMSTFMENTPSNLGPNVPSNTPRRFTWNMGADWSIDFAQIQVEVLAKDSRNLMGFHWITVPSDGTNTAIQVSSTPVPQSELLSIWYWLIATHNGGIAFANGSVTGVGGAFDGQVLASDSGTTSAGRAFAYSQMGVRAITQAEIDRANGGRYGFTSVDANSVVKLP